MIAALEGGEWSAARPGLLLLLLLLQLVVVLLVKIIIIPGKSVHSGELTRSQLVRKFPSLYGVQMFIASLLFVPVPKQMNPALPVLSYFFKTCFNTTLSSMLTSSKWSISFSFPTQTLYALLLSPIHVTSHARFIIHGLL